MRVRCFSLGPFAALARWGVAVCAGVLTLGPGEALACPVCFQGVDSPLLDSARAGVLAMAAVLVGVLGLFARWFVRLARFEAEATREDDGS